MRNTILLFLASLLVTLAACKQFSAPGKIEVIQSWLPGVWVVEYIGDRPVVDRSPARIHFAEDGTLNGNASCNRFFGKYSYTEETLIIEPLGTTKMACVPALMEQETRFLEAFPDAAHATLENEILILRDAAGQQIIRAVRDESEIQ